MVSNGLEGEAANGYLVLWSCQELIELNAAYQVKYFVADVILFGSDGADEECGFAISGTPASIVILPFIGMGTWRMNDWPVSSKNSCLLDYRLSVECRGGS